MDNEKTTDQLFARIDHLEQNSRFVQNALEMALSLGDFQENINERHDPYRVLQETEKRISRLIPFEICAICLVNEDDPDITISLCEPAEHRKLVENEMEFMTEKGLFAWALRERRGLLVKSNDQSKEFLLHVIASRSQIRGMFIGLLPDKKRRIPDASMSLLSLILLNTANAIESLESYNWVLKENSILEEKVEERTKELVKYGGNRNSCRRGGTRPEQYPVRSCKLSRVVADGSSRRQPVKEIGADDKKVRREGRCHCAGFAHTGEKRGSRNGSR